jgi:hypothetical protein
VIVALKLVRGPTSRTKLLTLRDEIVPTGVSQYLLAEGPRDSAPPEWRWLSTTERGVLGVMGQTHNHPLVLSDANWAILKTCYRPLLSDNEFVALLKLALHPVHNHALNRLLVEELVEAIEGADGLSAKRELVRKALGAYWPDLGKPCLAR